MKTLEERIAEFKRGEYLAAPDLRNLIHDLIAARPQSPVADEVKEIVARLDEGDAVYRSGRGGLQFFLQSWSALSATLRAVLLGKECPTCRAFDKTQDGITVTPGMKLFCPVGHYLGTAKFHRPACFRGLDAGRSCCTEKAKNGIAARVFEIGECFSSTAAAHEALLRKCDSAALASISETEKKS